jgi:hypothetical protein
MSGKWSTMKSQRFLYILNFSERGAGRGAGNDESPRLDYRSKQSSETYWPQRHGGAETKVVQTKGFAKCASATVMSLLREL